jgi:sec-independent protein translocase protein TatB
MFDLAWSEILLIAVVAVVFIGPKELPGALRTFGKWMTKARVMAAEFQRNLDDMVREAELEDVKKQFDEVRGIATNPVGAIEKWVDPKGEIRTAFTPPASGTTAVGTYDKPGLEKPVDKALDQPAAAAPTATPQPVAAPVAPVAVPAAAEPAPPAPQAATGQAAMPPAVTPPPAGTGASVAPHAPVETKTPATVP